MTDMEFASLLRSRRTLTPAQVEKLSKEHDAKYGLYVPTSSPHQYGESRH